MITQNDAQLAIKLLQEYISQCRGEISVAQKLINDSKTFLSLPEKFDIEDMEGLDALGYNTLRRYYASQKNRNIFNTSRRGLMQMRGCGKKTVELIAEVFGKYGIELEY